jgi:mono/diheme cytochrome c family protein
MPLFALEGAMNGTRCVDPVVLGFLGVVCGPLAACSAPGDRGQPADTAAARVATASAVERGRYLVNFGGCHDCHSPKILTADGPVVDTTRILSGHPADAKVPAVPAGVLGADGWGALTTPDLTAWAGPWGVSFSANLTPHETGLRNWNADQFIRAMRTGRQMGVGRAILPPMPWYDVGKLTDEDLRAVFAYLQSIPPVANPVPQPLPPPGGPPAR